MIEYLRIDHVALHVKNLAYSKSFYKKHFGFQTYFEHTTPNDIPIAYLKLGDTVLELTGIEDRPVKGFHFCLEVDKFDEAGVGKFGNLGTPNSNVKLQRFAISTEFSNASGRSWYKLTISDCLRKYWLLLNLRGREALPKISPLAIHTRASCAVKSFSLRNCTG